MKARINKGVKPYGGKTFPVLEFHWVNGNKQGVRLNVGFIGHMGMNSADGRDYRLDEVELIPTKEDVNSLTQILRNLVMTVERGDSPEFLMDTAKSLLADLGVEV